MSNRPDPDQLLKRVQEEEKASFAGQLKLFFGATAGVGKTYAMLEAARQRKKEGWDVVVGIVETHGRTETEALLDGLEILPRKDIDYKGVRLKELDIDAALKRRPTLILVDELAHANAPGSRHAKRWQDVEELLDAGIHVYTTLNVQHWESLNDVVAQITGVAVRETVPDSFLQRTHELELVDLAPEDLLKRLKEGKVYRGEQADRAADNFFQPGNLIALRELALRHTAERVDEQMQAYREQNAVEGVWPAGERLLVGVSPSPMSARLIRATRRMATRLHGQWTAVHVETPAFFRLPPEDRARVINNLRLAERLGAETVTLTGEDVTEELLAYARKQNISRIVIGKPARSRWKEWLYGSIVNELAHRCGDIDLHVISGFGSDLGARRGAPQAEQISWQGISWGAVLVALITALLGPLSQTINLVNLAMIYLLGVAAVAYRFGRLPSFVAALLSVLAFDFFFVPPRLTFAVSDAQYVVTFVVMFAVGILIGTLTSRLRFLAEQMRRREERTRVLYQLSRELSETPDPGQLLQAACSRLKEFYRLPVLIVVPRASGLLEVAAGDPAEFGWDSHEQSVAQWVHEHAQIAGSGTETLAGSKGLYLPLRGIRKIVGVLGLRPADPASQQDPEQLQLLETFASEIGGALESTRLTELAGRAEMQMDLLALTSAQAKSTTSLGDYVSEDRIVLLSPGQSRDQIIKRLIECLHLPNPVEAFEAIEERERIAPTLLQSGVAIPHARLAGLKEVKAAVGISSEGPVRAWILFFGPAENPKAHLAFLAQVAAFFQKTDRINDLQKLRSAKKIHHYLLARD
ncbi:MAG: DUF4118 domain-containing protein [Elusimicrobiota bacterium]|jgi:two-component system sensor histidine kinase KdpD